MESDRDIALAALDRAVDQIGSQSAMGRLLGVSQRAVWRWVRERKVLPPQHVILVEQKTGISRHDLRPDLYPRESAPAVPAATNIQLEGFVS